MRAPPCLAGRLRWPTRSLLAATRPANRAGATGVQPKTPRCDRSRATWPVLIPLRNLSLRLVQAVLVVARRSVASSACGFTPGSSRSPASDRRSRGRHRFRLLSDGQNIPQRTPRLSVRLVNGQGETGGADAPVLGEQLDRIRGTWRTLSPKPSASFEDTLRQGFADAVEQIVGRKVIGLFPRCTSTPTVVIEPLSSSPTVRPSPPRAKRQPRPDRSIGSREYENRGDRRAKLLRGRERTALRCLVS